MTREDAVGAKGGAAVTFPQVATLFGRLLGMALVLGAAFGLLLTAAAVALPAPAAPEEMAPERPQPARRQTTTYSRESAVSGPSAKSPCRVSRRSFERATRCSIS